MGKPQAGSVPTTTPLRRRADQQLISYGSSPMKSLSAAQQEQVQQEQVRYRT
eukprot:COSAG01_NODE_7217_length_3302_cov_2.154543_3_plen_52_part_00